MSASPSLYDHPTLSARQRTLLRLVAEQGFVTIDVLAETFDVSAQTIRRDLNALCDMNLLQRFHGGACLSDNALVPRQHSDTTPPWSVVRLGHGQKKHTRMKAKQRIARAVAAEIPNGASVFLDVGTTVEAVARALLHKSRLSIVTCSLTTGAIFGGHDSIETFVTGGILRGADGSLVGDAPLRCLEGFKVQYAVLGASSLEEDGTVMDFDIQKISLKQKAIQNSRQTFLAIDASKFNRQAIAKVDHIAKIHTLFTDEMPGSPLAAVLEQEKVRVVVAG